nr:RHS repeat-associated core domain-containing protein [Moritella viscosa]SHO18218.1 Putative uncharacterized protein [Moritella viscosa]
MKSINLTSLMIGLIFFSLFVGSVISQPAQGKTVFIPIAVPAMPFIRTANLARSGGGYNLTWFAVANASYYQLIITDENGEQRIVKVTGTSYVLSDFSLGSNKIEVKVCNANDRCGGAYYVGSAIRNTKVTYQHTDMLGSPVLETDYQGQVVSRSVYDPFGKRLGGEKEGIGYTGHLQDEDLGLTYMQARYYDPVIGRFYSNDPVRFTGNPHSFNRYAYVNNNPYKYTDPNGESPIHAFAFVVGAISSGYQTYQSSGGDIASTLKSAVIGGASAALSLSPGGIVRNIAKSFAVGVTADATSQVVVDGTNVSDIDTTQSLTSGGIAAASTLVGGAVASKVPVKNLPSVKGYSVPPGRTQRISAHPGTIKSDTLKQGVAGTAVGTASGITTGVISEKIHELRD